MTNVDNTTISDKNCETRNRCYLIQASYKFPCSFLASTAWNTFSRLGTILSPDRGETLGIFGQVKQFWRLMLTFYENIVRINNFCHWLLLKQLLFQDIWTQLPSKRSHLHLQEQDQVQIQWWCNSMRDLCVRAQRIPSSCCSWVISIR